MTLKLSDAMRLGAMLKPQRFGILSSPDGGTCAMGAAFDALGGLGELIGQSNAAWACSAAALWPWVMTIVRHPVMGDSMFHSSGVLNIIVDLNDRFQWSRERIADWIATIEPQDDATRVETPATIAELVTA